jgi:ribosome biogenesis GTPase
VTAVFRDRYEIVCEHGFTYAKLKIGAYMSGQEDVAYPTVGDFVMILFNEQGESLIAETLPRRSFFSRRDPTIGRGEQAIAANFDYVCILSSLNRDFNLSRLERYLTIAWQSGGEPVVLLTKADLSDDAEERELDVMGMAPGVSALAVSARTGLGMEKLNEYIMPGKTLVMLGSSGVGKSSLLNALAGRELMAVKDIREGDARGRHTTTHRQLFLLDSGAMVIDTPGMRELGMWTVEEGLAAAYGDVRELIITCRFADCKHDTEPGCAVRAAIANGSLQQERWERFLTLERESQYAEDRAAAMRIKSARNKAIAIYSRQAKRERRVRR